MQIGYSRSCTKPQGCCIFCRILQVVFANFPGLRDNFVQSTELTEVAFYVFGVCFNEFPAILRKIQKMIRNARIFENSPRNGRDDPAVIGNFQNMIKMLHKRWDNFRKIKPLQKNIWDISRNTTQKHCQSTRLWHTYLCHSFL